MYDKTIESRWYAVKRCMVMAGIAYQITNEYRRISNDYSGKTDLSPHGR